MYNVRNSVVFQPAGTEFASATISSWSPASSLALMSQLQPSHTYSSCLFAQQSVQNKMILMVSFMSMKSPDWTVTTMKMMLRSTHVTWPIDWATHISEADGKVPTRVATHDEVGRGQGWPCWFTLGGAGGVWEAELCCRRHSGTLLDARPVDSTRVAASLWLAVTQRRAELRRWR